MNVASLGKTSLNGVVELIATQNFDHFPSDEALQTMRRGSVT